MDKQMQHDYLFYSVPKRKRFKKDGWLKKTSGERNELKIIEDTARATNYSIAKTKQFMNMLTDSQRKELLERVVYPDSKNAKK
jgi:hypothetical protein